MNGTRVNFVVGTDTGVGKSVVTAMSLVYLQGSEANVRALKPFCSGERTDALLLWELQDRKLSLDEVNPFYFEEPVAPWTAARAGGRRVTREETVLNIRSQYSSPGGILLIEGAGGLLSPLGESFHAADLILDLNAEVILVAANRLGVINHTLLTLEALQNRQLRTPRVALVDVADSGASMKTNEEDLRTLRPELRIVRIPHIPDLQPKAEYFRREASHWHNQIAELFR